MLRKTVLPTVVLFAVLMPQSISASVILSEVSPWSDPDWVEIVNISTESASLEGIVLRDSSANNKKALTGTISGNGYYVVEFSNYLNKDGDTVSLVGGDGVTVDSMTYDGKSACGQTDSHVYVRTETGGFSEISGASPGSANPETEPVSCPTPVPTVKPTATPKPTTSPRPAAPATAVPMIQPTALPQLFVAVGEVNPEESEAVLTEVEEDYESTGSGQVLADAVNRRVESTAAPAANHNVSTSFEPGKKTIVKLLATISIITGSMGFFVSLGAIRAGIRVQYKV